MKKTKLLMTAPLAVVAMAAPALATSCNLFNPQPTTTTLSSISLSDAEFAYLEPSSSSSDRHLMKITTSKIAQTVTGTTSAGAQADITVEKMRKIDSQYMAMRLSGTYYGNYLVNYKTNQCYKLDDSYYFDFYDTRPTDAAYQKDSSGKTYFVNSSKVKCANLSDPYNIVLTDCTFSNDSVYNSRNFAVSSAGEVVYQIQNSGIANPAIRYRGTDGSFLIHEFTNNESIKNIWQANGNIYIAIYENSTTNIYHVFKHATTGELTLSKYNTSSIGYSIESTDVWHLNDYVINCDYNNKSIYRLYSGTTFTPASYTCSYQHVDAFGDGEKLYLSRVNAIDVYDPTKPSTIETKDVDGYEVLKTRVSSNGTILFQGTITSSSTQVICQYTEVAGEPVITKICSLSNKLDTFEAL